MRKEGKPALLAEVEPQDDPTHGMCPRHRVQIEEELSRSRAEMEQIRKEAEAPQVCFGRTLDPVTGPTRGRARGDDYMDGSPPKREVTVTISRGETIISREPVSLRPIEVVPGSAEGIRDLGKVQYPPVGYCIYCGAANDLRREHIVPFGLNGTAVLLAASCSKCARVTGAFEAQVLRGPMRAVRVLRRLRSRSRHAGAPGTQRLKVVRDGVSHTVELPIDQFPILLHFPDFAPPRFLTGRAGTGIELTGVGSVLFGPTPEEVLRRLGAQRIILESQGDQPVAFARMLAKIGYAMALAEGALNRLDGPCPILPAILGDVDDLGRWVGTLTDPIRRYPELLHRVAIHEDRRGLLVAEIQLFADSETPSYGVILGRLRAS